MQTLTVIVPIFNEERTIAQIVSNLNSLPKNVISECIFVNDGSTDTTSQLLTKSLIGVSFKSVVIDKENGGKSSAIKEGAKLLSTTHAVILDADLEYSVGDLEKLWEVVTSGKSDYVFGYRRFYSHTSFTWRYSRGNQLISNIYGLLFNEIITDVMSGYKMIPSREFKELPFRYKNFGIEVEIPMRMWQRGIRPVEIEISYSPRSRSEGKSITVKDAFTTIASMFLFRLGHKKKMQDVSFFYVEH